MESQQEIAGKKIFLLYPHSVIREEMLDLLIMAGYETYTLSDVKKAQKLLKMFPGSIMFINIDEGLKEPEWESYIRGIQNDPATNSCHLGIMSYNHDRDLMKKYLMDMSVSCGYIQLKLGLQESAKILINALEANEARGRRKYIRAGCKDDLNAKVNFKENHDLHYGKILDISSVGIAAEFDKPVDIALKALLREVQLKLRVGLVHTDMIYLGQRSDNKSIYIMLFDGHLSSGDKLVIHRYIKNCLQKYIDTLKV